MRTVARAMSVALLLVVPASSRGQTPDVQKVDIAHLIPKGRAFFTGAAEHWEATYQGKNRPSIVVSILGVKEGNEDLVLLQTTLGTREDIPLSRNLAVKLLELSGDWDFAKVVLYDKFVAIRLDHPTKGLDAATLEKLCEQVASATDLALSEVKNFLP